MTNLEKIRAMSVEDLSTFLYHISCCCDDGDPCPQCPIYMPCHNSGRLNDYGEWLKSEVEE